MPQHRGRSVATHIDILAIGPNARERIIIGEQRCTGHILLARLENTAAHVLDEQVIPEGKSVVAEKIASKSEHDWEELM